MKIEKKMKIKIKNEWKNDNWKKWKYKRDQNRKQKKMNCKNTTFWKTLKKIEKNENLKTNDHKHRHDFFASNFIWTILKEFFWTVIEESNNQYWSV